MRPLAVFTATLALGGSVFLPVPAFSHGEVEQPTSGRSARVAEVSGSPTLSDNVTHLVNKPGQAGISGCFMKTAPIFVTSGVQTFQVWDVSKRSDPTTVGVLPNPVFENEAMNCGERESAGGTQRFALIGVDLAQTSPSDPQHTNAGGKELIVVDVTDPSAPAIRSRVTGLTSTHTVACVDETDCRYAYSAGSSKTGTFSVFDLRDLDKPREVDSDPDKAGLQAFASPTAGHKWNFDSAGIGTHTGFDGSSMWQTDNPRHPKLITTTGRAGKGLDPKFPGYNDFIHHNSFRPNADNFKPSSKPSFANGNVLLVTEEDYEQTDCSLAGSFQAWHVKRLDGTPSAIVPLDKVELADLQKQQPGSVPLPQGGFCSAHWFDFRQGGIAAVGYYGGGTQLIDTRDPGHLRSFGYAYWGASEVWDNAWVPVYDAKGVQTGKKSHIVYAIDLIRGLDVYSVDVPGGSGS